jgi:hypothetical protein
LFAQFYFKLAHGFTDWKTRSTHLGGGIQLTNITWGKNMKRKKEKGDNLMKKKEKTRKDNGTNKD